MGDKRETLEYSVLERPEVDADHGVGVVVVESPDPAATLAARVIDGTLLIGRDASDEESSLTIDDVRLSRHHARISRRRNLPTYRLEDLGSRNGTYLNARRVDEESLAEGSVVRVGKTLLYFGVVPRHPGGPIDGEIVGVSTGVRHVVQTIDKVARTDLSVLINGDSGTGKELLARRLHARSAHAKGPLVDVNCAAIPSDLLEAHLFGHKRGAFTSATEDAAGLLASADGGTLFLDEVGEMAPSLQAKLLRVLETREYRPVGSTAVRRSRFRLVAATNKDLLQAIALKSFREDLYARLSACTVELPPLRARRCDIPLLARHFLRELAGDRPIECSVGFFERLMLHDWPRNVRELRSTIHRTLALVGEQTSLHADDLDVGDKLEDQAGSSIPTAEELVRVMRKLGGNVSRVARHYDRDRRQIYRWLEAYGIRVSDFREDEDEPGDGGTNSSDE